MSPEQAGDPRLADIRSDIYSLGCTLYFLLAGQPPFPAGSLLQKLKAHAEHLPPEICGVRSDVPPELSAVLSRMMSKDPGYRYQTPIEVASALFPCGRREPSGRATAAGTAIARPPRSTIACHNTETMAFAGGPSYCRPRYRTSCVSDRSSVFAAAARSA